MAIIETMTFRLRSDADEADFLQADQRVQVAFAYQQPGLVRRTTARSGDGGWIVVDLWESAPDADAMAERWETADAPAPSSRWWTPRRSRCAATRRSADEPRLATAAPARAGCPLGR